jgi:hypothetical protein
MTPLGQDAEREARLADLCQRLCCETLTQDEYAPLWQEFVELHALRSAQQVLRMERDMKLT